MRLRLLDGLRVGTVGVWTGIAGMGCVCAAAMGQAAPDLKTWDIFAGASFVRLAASTTASTQVDNRNATGFDLSVTERPYQRYPWLGGTIEGSGAFASSTYSVLGTNYNEAQHLYTLMGGPMLQLQRQRVQPFARALFGDTFSYLGISTEMTPSSTSTRNFGYALGGGVDFLVNPSWAVRGQGDWIRTATSSTQSSGAARASLGVVYKF